MMTNLINSVFISILVRALPFLFSFILALISFNYAILVRSIYRNPELCPCFDEQMMRSRNKRFECFRHGSKQIPLTLIPSSMGIAMLSNAYFTPGNSFLKYSGLLFGMLMMIMSLLAALSYEQEVFHLEWAFKNSTYRVIRMLGDNIVVLASAGALLFSIWVQILNLLLSYNI